TNGNGLVVSLYTPSARSSRRRMGWPRLCPPRRTDRFNNKGVSTVRHLWTGVACLCVTAIAGTANAATLTVNAGADLQGALNAAQPGDWVLLQAGATFTGNYTLPAKNGTADITIRSSAPDT